MEERRIDDGVAADSRAAADRAPRPVDLVADLARLSAAQIRELEAQVDQLKADLHGQQVSDLLRREERRPGEGNGPEGREDRLEREVRELRAELDRRRDEELERLRKELQQLRAQQNAPSAPAVATPAPDSLGQQLVSYTLPTYLYAAYGQASDLLAQAEAKDQLRKAAEAGDVRFQAAHLACEALWRLSTDEEHFARAAAVVDLARERRDEIRTAIERDDRFEQWRRVSIQLLVLGGLGTDRAAELVDSCRADFLTGRVDPARQPAVSRHNVRRLRNAVCGETKAGLAAAARRAQGRDRMTGALVKGLGAAGLEALTLPAGGLLGPFAAAVIGALGGAGVDAAADLAKAR